MLKSSTRYYRALRASGASGLQRFGPQPLRVFCALGLERFGSRTLRASGAWGFGCFGSWAFRTSAAMGLKLLGFVRFERRGQTVVERKLREFPAVTKVDGLAPAVNRQPGHRREPRRAPCTPERASNTSSLTQTCKTISTQKVFSNDKQKSIRDFDKIGRCMDRGRNHVQHII